ncbi:prepilin peptidase [Sphingomonas lenta]|uniref:Prepilin leader peptidase/N-methyltransferase n=1 Tax=Sphingomonas lenta TaxID=1141887 RepID=A0A2A2SBJ7_9SPHN|nr:A24 family peptidase [Sphingomonas lenta]PAX06674.1 prepilin peptidase [Sphingomonas lenta]
MLLPILLALVGAIVGSFLATLVVRWPEGRSVVAGRSACDGCGRPLRAWELVPLVSALGLRGRCAACGRRIDPVHGRVELACSAMGLGAGLVAPWPEAAAGAVFGWLLVALAALDWRHFWLPDRLTGLLALGGLLSAAVAPPGVADRLIGGAAGFGSLWVIAWGYRRFRGREGMGGGDPKLMGAIGLWLGWRLLPGVLVVAGMVGLGVVLFRRWRGEAVAADSALPFGALLAVATYPAWLLMISVEP